MKPPLYIHYQPRNLKRKCCSCCVLTTLLLRSTESIPAPHGAGGRNKRCPFCLGMIRDEGALHTHFVPVHWPGLSPTIGFCAHISAQRDSLALSSAISIIAISSHSSVLTSKQPHLVLFTCSPCQLGIMMFSVVEMVAPLLTWKAKTNTLFCSWNAGRGMRKDEEMICGDVNIIN